MEEVEKWYISTVVGETVVEDAELHDDSVKGGEDLSGEAGSENAAVKLYSVVSERQLRDQSIVGTDSCTMEEDAAGAVGHPGTSLFADILETIDSILYMPIGNDKVDGNSNIVDIEEMSNLGNDKFDANSNIVVDIMETIDSILNMPIGNDKVDGKTSIVHEVVCGTEFEKCNAEEQLIADKDVSGVSALNAEQSDVYEGMEIDVENRQGTERSKTMNQIAKVKGLPVSIEGEEKRMSDPMNGTPDFPDGDCWTPDHLVSPEHSKKRSTFDHFDDDFKMQTGKKTISVAEVSNTTNSLFKIGDCIRRADSQLTPKKDVNVGVFPANGLDVSPTTVEYDENTTEYLSLVDMLSSLQCVAQKPLGEYTFLNGIVSFFSDFKNSVIVTAVWKEISRTDELGTKRKKKPPIARTGFVTFEDMRDSHWTDRVIDNGNEEKPVQQPLLKNQKKDEQPVAVKLPKPAQVNRGPYSWEKNSESNHAENAPAELVMNFAEFKSVPSETNLNKMFRRFGQLKESETEVDRVSSRARVVFKKRVDAEVAIGSAKKFNIFGSVVNYQLNYTPSAFKAFRNKI